jgi:hypothetical protein
LRREAKETKLVNFKKSSKKEQIKRNEQNKLELLKHYT